ncbi:MAG: HlyD family secretion protein [Acidobacteriota bacterium]|nr:HlyD family secretion protein [Acidobacteriota bacterium]
MSTQEEVKQETPTQQATPATPTRGRRKAFTIFFVVLLVLGAAGLLLWMRAQAFEDTDDAQVEAHLNPISSRVDGTITKVYVEDNQSVTAGAPLVDLDPRDFRVALDQALAQLTQARSMVIGQEPNVPITQVENTTNISSGEADVATARAALGVAQRDRDTAIARLAEAEANNARAQADLARYKLLIAKEEVSEQEYGQIAATAKAQAATVNANQASLESYTQVIDQRQAQLQQTESKLNQYRRTAPQQVAIRRAAVASERASAQSSQAMLESAQLKLSYTKIAAPVAGIVMQRSAEVGAHVSAGQQLLQIAQISDLWVTANFKETQLRRIKPGQSVAINVDALKRNFDGYVATIGGATGAITSVLPPENATGNFVKVVQRIPVRIRFKPNQDGMDRLRPGMSVEPKVRVGN